METLKDSAPKVSFASSIFLKIAVVIAVCVGLVAGALTLISLETKYQLVLQTVRDRALVVTQRAAEQSIAPIKFKKTQNLVEYLDRVIESENGGMEGAIATNFKGDVIAGATGLEAGNLKLHAVAQQVFEKGVSLTADDGKQAAFPIFNVDGKSIIGVVAMGWNTNRQMQVIWHELGDALLFATLIFGVAMAASMYFVQHVLLRPMGDIGRAMLAVAARDYVVAMPAVERKDEIGLMAKTLEKMRTELHLGEQAISENAYKGTAFTRSSAAMMLVDSSFRINYINDSMRLLLEYHGDGIRQTVPDFDVGKLIGSEIDMFHQKSGMIRAMLEKTGDNPHRMVMTLGDARISLSIIRISDDAEQAIGYVVEWADITQDWLNQAILKAIDSDQATALFNMAGDVIELNEQMTAMLGLTDKPGTGENIHARFSDGEVGATSFNKVVEEVISAHAYQGKLYYKSNDGMNRIIEGSLSCVRDHSGHPIRLLLIGKDVTDAEAALEAAHQARISAEFEQGRVVDALRVGLKQLSNGDLTVRISEPFDGKYEELRQDYNLTVETLSNVLRDVIGNAESIMNEARDISTTAESLSRRTENTAATLEQSASALDELTQSVRSAAEGAAEVDRVVADARVNAEQSGEIVLETAAAMDLIAESSDKITSIIKVIDDIAFQTNLLALNAGVEAARAGDAGRGFAVVASEVRALAQRSSEAAREINGLIANSGSQVKHGVDLVGKTGIALKQIVGSVSNISALVSEIAVSSRQQSIGLAEINSAVNDLDQSTQQNAARLEETTAASEALTNDAISLVQIVSHFQIDEAVSDESAQDQVVVFKSRKPAETMSQSAVENLSGELMKSVASGGGRHVARPVIETGWEDF